MPLNFPRVRTLFAHHRFVISRASPERRVTLGAGDPRSLPGHATTPSGDSIWGLILLWCRSQRDHRLVETTEDEHDTSKLKGA